MSLLCPKCGARQDSGSECVHCGLILRPFERARKLPARPDVPGRGAGAPPGGFRRFVGVVRWVVPGAAVVVLLLILRTAEPPATTADPGAAGRLEKKVQALATDRGLGRSRPLRIDEAELNDWLRSSLARAAQPAARGVGVSPSAPARPGASMAGLEAPTSLPGGEAGTNVRDIRVHMEGEQLTAYVLFNLYGKDLSLTLQGGLSVQDGHLKLIPSRMMLGSLPLPRAMLDRAVASLFDSAAGREALRLPPEIRDLRIENGELTITYR